MEADTVSPEFLSIVLKIQSEKRDKVFWITRTVGHLNLALFIIGELVFGYLFFNSRLASYFIALAGSLVVLSPSTLLWLDVFIAVFPATFVLKILRLFTPNPGFWMLWVYCQLFAAGSYTLKDLALYRNYQNLGAVAFRLPQPS